MQNTPKRIQSVQRAIDIISCFHHTDIELSLGEISTALSLNKSTVHGIISTLYANNYVTQVPSGKYKLGSIFTAAKYEGKATRRIILKENLSQIRWRGYSTEDEELGQGIYAVSTPIYDEKDELFATLSITGLSVTLRGNQELIDELLAASKNLSYSF